MRIVPIFFSKISVFRSFKVEAGRRQIRKQRQTKKKKKKKVLLLYPFPHVKIGLSCLPLSCFLLKCQFFRSF